MSFNVDYGSGHHGGVMPGWTQLSLVIWLVAMRRELELEKRKLGIVGNKLGDGSPEMGLGDRSKVWIDVGGEEPFVMSPKGYLLRTIKEIFRMGVELVVVDCWNLYLAFRGRSLLG